MVFNLLFSLLKNLTDNTRHTKVVFRVSMYTNKGKTLISLTPNPRIQPTGSGVTIVFLLVRKFGPKRVGVRGRMPTERDLWSGS